MLLNVIQLGDCLALMRQLPDASVDVIINDPPYHTTQLHYGRAPMIDWAAWWREANRVVKPGGTIVLFADDLFTIDLILTNRKQYRYRLVWEKTRRTRFLDANRRPLKAHEDILVFQRKPRQTVYNPQKTEGSPYKTGAITSNIYHHVHPMEKVNSGTRHPGTVLRFASTRESSHPNEKPKELISWLVRTYTNPGQVVLDTFAGSATTAVACLEQGRNFICYERDESYFFKAQARIEAAEQALALSV